MTYPLYLAVHGAVCVPVVSHGSFLPMKRDSDGKRRQKYSIYSGTWLIYRHK